MIDLSSRQTNSTGSGDSLENPAAQKRLRLFLLAIFSTTTLALLCANAFIPQESSALHRKWLSITPGFSVNAPFWSTIGLTLATLQPIIACFILALIPKHDTRNAVRFLLVQTSIAILAFYSVLIFMPPETLMYPRVCLLVCTILGPAFIFLIGRFLRIPAPLQLSSDPPKTRYFQFSFTELFVAATLFSFILAAHLNSEISNRTSPYLTYSAKENFLSEFFSVLRGTSIYYYAYITLLPALYLILGYLSVKFLSKAKNKFAALVTLAIFLTIANFFWHLTFGAVLVGFIIIPPEPAAIQHMFVVSSLRIAGWLMICSTYERISRCVPLAENNFLVSPDRQGFRRRSKAICLAAGIGFLIWATWWTFRLGPATEIDRIQIRTSNIPNEFQRLTTRIQGVWGSIYKLLDGDMEYATSQTIFGVSRKQQKIKQHADEIEQILNSKPSMYSEFQRKLQVPEYQAEFPDSAITKTISLLLIKAQVAVHKGDDEEALKDLDGAADVAASFVIRLHFGLAGCFYTLGVNNDWQIPNTPVRIQNDDGAVTERMDKLFWEKFLISIQQKELESAKKSALADFRSRSGAAYQTTNVFRASRGLSCGFFSFPNKDLDCRLAESHLLKRLNELESAIVAEPFAFEPALFQPQRINVLSRLRFSLGSNQFRSRKIADESLRDIDYWHRFFLRHRKLIKYLVLLNISLQFKSENGRFPKSWDELTPKYLSAPLVDEELHKQLPVDIQQLNFEINKIM